jgi:hypothetical protein
MAACVVERTRPGERVQQIESVTSAMLELCLQRVIGEKSLGKGLLDGGERLNGTALRQAQTS